MCYPTPIVLAVQQAIPNSCSAKTLAPSQRLTLGLHALAGTHSVTHLAEQFDVSRKFVYQQAATAQAALDDAFTAATGPDQVLFELPVTKHWLRQVTLGLTLICHSSYRGVSEFCRDLLGVKLPVGTVHNILQAAIAQARPYNRGQDLAAIDIAGLDEIFQQRQPVFVGADIASTYCFLLSREDHRDADTWAARLRDAQARGLAPRATIADFALGIRAGQERALPGVPCRGDTFHAAAELTALVACLEKRAYKALAAQHRLEQQKTKSQQQARRDQTRQRQALGRKAYVAGQAAAQAVAVADDVAVLAQWLRHDVFAISGLPYPERCGLFDFIVAELQARQAHAPQQLRVVCTLLQNHREELLAFAKQLDQDLAQLAADFQVPQATAREVLDLQALDPRQARYWQKQAALRQRLRQRFGPLQQAVQALAAHVVRASSVIENINSRLRSYFYLRRQLGCEYLELLQFFLNHRRFLRSERAERVRKSPAELLTGHRHPHWLEMLGYTPFSRN